MRSFFIWRHTQAVALSLAVSVLAPGPGAVAETIFVTDPSDTKMALDQPISEAAGAQYAVRAPTQSLAGPMGARSPEKVEAELPQTGFTRYARKSIRVHGDREVRGATVIALSRQNPDFSIIECVANCVGPVGMIVYFKPRVPTATQALANSGMVQTANVSSSPQVNAIVCLAGCYDRPSQPASAVLPLTETNLQTAVVVSSADMTPKLGVLTTRNQVSNGRVRRLKSRVGQTQARHPWRVERPSVSIIYARSYRAGYRAY